MSTISSFLLIYCFFRPPPEKKPIKKNKHVECEHCEKTFPNRNFLETHSCSSGKNILFLTYSCGTKRRIYYRFAQWDLLTCNHGVFL